MPATGRRLGSPYALAALPEVRRGDGAGEGGEGDDMNQDALWLVVVAIIAVWLWKKIVEQT